jgi:hypothetical protein
MAGRFSRSLELARASWSVVQADKELMWFPVMSFIALVLILGSVAAPVVVLGGLGPETAAEPSPASWLGVLAFYILAYFIGLFFNTALVGAAMIRLDGGNPTVGDGLRVARSRVGAIFGYACIAATVGMFLRALEDRVGWVGTIIVRLIGVAWALATFLVVPVLVTRDVGPVDAVKESAVLLKETWGENIIGSVGLSFAFGVAYFGLILVFGVAIGLAVQANLPTVIAALVLVGVVSFLLLATLQATMQGVYSAALYRNATRSGTQVPGFDPDLLQQAFKSKA